MPSTNLRRYDEDEQTGATEYSRFLHRHLPARADGRWLADRRDAPPPHAVLLPHRPNELSEEDAESNWRFEITSDMFTSELLRSPDSVTVWAYRDVEDCSRRETARITSALVTPATAPVLLRALQTAPDKHAFRVPDANDHEYSSRLPGFELIGWIEPRSYGEGIERRDPYAGDIYFPPHRPTKDLDGLERLIPDADMRVWRNEKFEPVLYSRAWDAKEGSNRRTGTSGEELVADRSWLVSQLRKLDRWLLIEVEFERYVESSRSRPATRSPDDDRFRYLPPYTKYFLIDTTGAIHDL